MDVILDKTLLGDESEADLTQWLVADGDSVAEGQPLADFETAKVQLQLPAPKAGVVRIVAAAGSVVLADGVVARIE